MSQKTLEGKTDCRKERTKGTAIIRFNGNNKEIMEGLEEVHKKYPCVKITVNGQKLEEIPKGWIGDPE
jgi:hypothetical protein